ncbi:MAG: N-formylglutamate amidohydrolase [Planctomycetia bacterium]
MPPIGILHVPHSSTEIPADLRSSFLLAEDQLRREVLRMTDWYTDELFALPAHEATTVRFPVSRLVVDPERFVDDAEEPMAGRGMGVIYTKTADGLPLRALPSPQERQQLLDRFYHPHHQRLAGAVQGAMEQHGGCLVIDCHSFPSVALPCDLDQAPDRPDICIGTDAFHTPDWVASLAAERFTAAGLTVAVNRPYSGALVPAEFCGRDRRVSSLMIEVSRGRYMQEDGGEKIAAFDDMAGVVQGVMRELLERFRLTHHQ